MQNTTVRCYRAKTLHDALQLVQRDLGPDAAVLQTKEVWDGWLRGLVGCRQVEVVASRHIQVPSRFNDEPGLDAGRLSGMSRTVGSNPRLPAPLVWPSVPPAEYENYRCKFRNDLKGQLGDLESWIGELRRRDRDETSEWHASLFALFTQLVDAEMDEELARQLVARVRSECSAEELADSTALRGRLSRILQADIRIQGPIQITPGAGKIVALVGPTGVGKTTTIAKLAANFHLRDKCRVGLITVDTYRIAAVEQLRTYADIIDLPMEVVSTTREMREAIGRLASLDLILMDTAGRGPRDEIRLRELKAMLHEAEADEVHLVLSATASPGSLTRTAEHFRLVGPTALLLTKLDEATGLGNLISLWRSCHLPLSYVTNGQNVPDDIRAADQRYLAEAALSPRG